MAAILIIGVSDFEKTSIRTILAEHTVLQATHRNDALTILSQNEDVFLIIAELKSLGTSCSQVLDDITTLPQFIRRHIILLTSDDEDIHEIENLPLEPHIMACRSEETKLLHTLIVLQLERRHRRELMQRLREQTSLFNSILWQSPVGIAISQGNCPSGNDKDDLFVVNPIFEQITGRTREELLSLGWVHITHPDDVAVDLQNYHKLMTQEIQGYHMDKRYIKPDGSIVWVHMIVARIDFPNTNTQKHISIIQDISDRKAIEEALIESERSKSVLLTHLPGMAYRCNYDHDWTMQYVSAGCFDLTGFTSEELLYNKKLSYNEIIAPEYQKLLWNEWEHCLSLHIPFKREYEIITAQKERKWVLEIGQGVYSETGEIEALEGIILDITERKKAENELTYHHDHDLWTGLYNRRYFIQLLKQDLNHSIDERKRAIIGFNLSTIHLLSIRYGFQYSQEVMKKVARALLIHCNQHIQLFNTYENRFVYYVTKYETREDLLAITRKASQTIDSILSVERINWGTGIIEIDQHNQQDIEQLLRNLLIASERSTISSEEDFPMCFFDDYMKAQIDREEYITQELTQILSDKHPERLILHYQPIFDLKTKRIYGFEALARLKSDKFGLISPLEFIPIAEKTKLIIPLGEIILRQACSFLNTMKSNGYENIRISVNISPIQLLDPSFMDMLRTCFCETQIDSTSINLEITESAVSFNFEEVNSILGEMKKLGVDIALDDFGTGYSSLSRERELHVDIIKIDKLFIDRMLSLKPEEAITQDIISMAHRLNQRVIAEGVENEQQLEYLQQFGCDMIQGYVMSKPVDHTLAYNLLTIHNPRGCKDT